MGNGIQSNDLCNDRIVELMDLFGWLSGFQQGGVNAKEYQRYKKRAKRLIKQLKRDLLKNTHKEVFFTAKEQLENLRPIFDGLEDKVFRSQMSLELDKELERLGGENSI